MHLRSGFTLFELVIVLAILAAMVTVIAPYAGRSNENLKLENQTRELADTIKYAIHFSETHTQKVRFCLDTNRKSFYLETSNEEGQFSRISSPVGQERYLSPNSHLMDIEGFEMEGQNCFLEFDPAVNWPSAHFTILGQDFKKSIDIQSKTVMIKDLGDV